MRTWILQRFQVYARVGLLAALFLSPIVWYRSTVDVFNLVKITILWVGGVAALALWLAWSAERGIWIPRVRLAYAAAAFLAVCVLATAFSQNPALSLIGLYHRYGGLIPFTLFAVIALLIVGLYWESPGDLKEIARAATAASILMAAYVLIQAAGLDWIKWTDASGRPPEFPVGTMGNSNFAGGYLGIAAPFFCYVALSARRPFWKTILLVMLGLDLLAIWFTQTRGGMIAAGVGLTAMAAWYWRLLPRWTKAMVSVAVTAGLVVAVLVAFHPGSKRPPAALGGINTFRTGTFQIRTYYWGAAWRIMTANPILGTGLETYYANYPRHRLPADGADLGLTITDKPHNIYLEYAANAGLLGVGSYLALVGLGLWFAYRRTRGIEGPERLLLVSFLSVLAGYLAQGFFSIDVPPLAVMGWVALGGIATLADPKTVEAREKLVALAQESRPRSKRGKRQRRDRLVDTSSFAFIWTRDGGPLRWPIHGAVFGVTLVLLFLGTRPFLADVAAKAGQVKEVGKQPADVVGRDYAKAIKIFPLEPTYRSILGAMAERGAAEMFDKADKQRALGRALLLYKQAFNLQPGNVFYMLNIARVNTTWAEAIDAGRFQEADRWWRRAVDHDPTDWAVHNQYALMLNSWANSAEDLSLRRRTAEQLELVTRIRPSEVSAWINLGKVYLVLAEPDKARTALMMALEVDAGNREAQSLLASL